MDVRKYFISTIMMAFGFWPNAFSVPASQHPVEDDTLTIAFTGDILLDRGVRKCIEKNGTDAIFSASIDSLFRTCKLVVGNLECPATKIQQRVYKRFMFRAEPEWLLTLKKHGITHLNMANNHSIDQGREGLLDTKRNIEQAGMVAVGVGRNMQEAAAPLLLAEQPRHVYLLVSQRLPLENFAYLPNRPSVSQESMDSLCARIRRLKAEEPDCYVIVNVHWGWEHKIEPTLKQRQEAHEIVSAGADLIIGHHTHSLQTVETWQGTPIYYSLGNFIFDLDKPVNTKTCVVKVVMTKDGVTINALPVEIRQCVPYVLEAL